MDWRLHFQWALNAEFVYDYLVNSEAVDLRDMATRWCLHVNEKLRSSIPWTEWHPPLFPWLQSSSQQSNLGWRLGGHVWAVSYSMSARTPLPHPFTVFQFPRVAAHPWQLFLSTDSMRAFASLDDTGLDFSFRRCHFWRLPFLQASVVVCDMKSGCGATNSSVFHRMR